MSIDDYAKPQDVTKGLKAVAELLDRNGIDPAEIGKIQRINMWQGVTKDEEGNAHVHDLVGVQLDPIWAEGPQWEPATRAAQVKLTKPRGKPKPVTDQALILPDTQIGFRRIFDKAGDSTLEPFHDDRALDLAVQVAQDLQPKIIVLLGDYMDFAEFGRFEKEPTFVETVNPSLDRGHRFLAELRNVCPNSEIHLIQGNHDKRLGKDIAMNAAFAYGLTRPGDDWPVLSLPHLLHMEALDINYVEGYPNGEVWLDDNTVCIHGSKVRSSGSTAAMYVKDENVSVIFGHIHRVEYQSRRVRKRGGSHRTFAASPGALCRTDGAVPSFHGSQKRKDGSSMAAVENWEQGMALVSFLSGESVYQQIPIVDGQALVGGRIFTAS